MNTWGCVCMRRGGAKTVERAGGTGRMEELKVLVEAGEGMVRKQGSRCPTGANPRLLKMIANTRFKLRS